MASTDGIRSKMPAGGGQIPTGKPLSMEQILLDKGIKMLQSLKPMKQIKQLVCTFALYSMTRQTETHHDVSRLNQGFLQCAVYNSDDSDACFFGDRLPLGAPALIMSPQAEPLGMVKPWLVQRRDDKYSISSDALKNARVDIAEPESINLYAD